MLNKVERFSSCRQANARGFLPYNAEFKKEFNVYCFYSPWRRRFEDEAFEEGAPVSHMGKALLFHPLLCTLGLPYLHMVKLTRPSGPRVVMARQHQTVS